jgi:DNA repair photolyase
MSLVAPRASDVRMAVMPQKQPNLFDRAGRAEGPEPRRVGGAAVREVACKSLLNRCGIADYSFNCYTGCGHGCIYCYARFMQRFHPHDEPWGKFVDVKVNARDALARQLRRLPPGEVFTCSACDGWQPVERDCRLTRRCCEMLLDAGFGLNILTKSELLLRDMDVLAGRNVRVGVTITTPDERQARLWEPKASSVAGRLRILREAKAAGLRTAVMFGPLLPGISDSQEVIGELFRRAAELGVDRIWTDAINPRPRVWPSVQGFLRRTRPELLETFRRVLFDGAYRRRYLEELDRRVRRAARAAGMTDRLA